MIKYIPKLDQAMHITYEGVTFPVSSSFDHVTVDTDGSVYGWDGVLSPKRLNGEWSRGHKESESNKKLIGVFERDDGKEFEPEIWNI